MTSPVSAAAVKACCADAYSSDLVALVLGESYHPGGLALTRRLAGHLALTPGAEVLDVAAGRGATALMLAREHPGLRFHGVDLSGTNVAAAAEAATAAGLCDRVIFRHGDAEALPHDAAAFDAVICECALCTFPDKATALAEMARVLRPGGRLGLTDVTADPVALPASLRSLAARVACVADALPAAGYVDLIVAAGLRVEVLERHDAAAARMVDQIEARLTVARMALRAQVEAAGLDLAVAMEVLGQVRSAIAAGTLGYVLLIAVKPL